MLRQRMVNGSEYLRSIGVLAGSGVLAACKALATALIGGSWAKNGRIDSRTRLKLALRKQRMQMQRLKCNTPPSGRRWRRRSVLTCSSMTIADVVLARGTDAASLRALRATCTSLRDALRDVTQFRLREQCAHELRVLPKKGALKAITAVLADDEDATHLQLDDGLVDIASLRGSWDNYAVSEENWRVPWPEARGRTVALGGWKCFQARHMLCTPWRGIRHIELTRCQLYVDEGACMSFEYEASGGLLLGVEILSSRWYFTDPAEAPTLRVSSPQNGVLRGSTSVKSTRAHVDSDSFEDDATLDHAGEEWTTVYAVTHTLATPLPLARSTRVVVEVDCRRHSCNAAVHNVFFRVAV